MNVKVQALIKTIWLPAVFFLFFAAVAVWRYSATGNAFYLFNFGYLGIVLSTGILLSQALPKKYSDWLRRIILFLVGGYLLFYVGFWLRENMQIEGFFFYFFAGIFAAATLHYFIAKVFGPLIFGRGWCGWACWTAMVLDLLPWKRPGGRYKYFGLIRYLHFLIIFALTFYVWYVLHNRAVVTNPQVQLTWLAVGSLGYYLLGIILAATLKDNRAFCKYVCPIPTFLKITSRFSLIKIKIDSDKCVECGTCERVCPMNIKLLNYKRLGRRILSSECILCSTCLKACPRNAIKTTSGFDAGFKEEINFK
jgi:ferredoxin-type protein NapH